MLTFNHYKIICIYYPDVVWKFMCSLFSVRMLEDVIKRYRTKRKKKNVLRALSLSLKVIYIVSIYIIYHYNEYTIMIWWYYNNIHNIVYPVFFPLWLYQLLVIFRLRHCLMLCYNIKPPTPVKLMPILYIFFI